jgi:ribonucleoside-diphosphate reductase alpha chain
MEERTTINRTTKSIKIVKITPIANEDVYDIGMETNHNFFANGICVHNCAEAVLPADGNCNLGSLNLSRMYDEETNDVDWKLLSKVIRHAVRALDNVLTMNIYPTPETKVAAERSRRIGLGTMGLHHLLIKMGITYGSDSSLEFIERLYTTIRNEAFDASIDIAKEKGSFQEYNYSEYTKNQYIKKLPSRLLNKMKTHGIRNAVLLSVAPNGTISMLAGTSSGIEPIFAPMYLRKYRKEGAIAEEVIVDKMFDEFVRSGKKYEHIVGAYDVTPEQHLAVQAAVQDSTDQAISKTINLPQDFEATELMDIILKFSERLKGMTVYRAGSREDEPLKALSPTKKNVEQYIHKDNNAGIINPECSTGSCEI